MIYREVVVTCRRELMNLAKLLVDGDHLLGYFSQTRDSSHGFDPHPPQPLASQISNCLFQ